MNTERHLQEEQRTAGQDKSEKNEISLPRIERPNGPFEHSGETSRWTKEEKEEKEEQKQSGDFSQP